MSHQIFPETPLAEPKPHAEVLSTLLANNTTFARTHTASPTMPTMTPYIRANPSRILLITCSDPRLDVPTPTSILGLPPSQTLTLRNGGGSASQDSLRSLLAIDSLIPFTDIIVMKHTDCGSGYYTNDGVRETIKEQVTEEVFRREEVGEMVFKKAYGSMEEGVRSDLKWLRGHPLIREELRGRVVGFVYDIETGKVKLME